MYTTYAKQYDSAARDNIYNALLERPSTIALLDDVKGLDIVDLGCGSGIYAQWFIDQGANKVTCTDLSQDMVDLVNGKQIPNVTAYAQDAALGLPKEADNSADVSGHASAHADVSAHANAAADGRAYQIYTKQFPAKKA